MELHQCRQTEVINSIITGDVTFSLGGVLTVTVYFITFSLLSPYLLEIALASSSLLDAEVKHLFLF